MTGSLFDDTGSSDERANVAAGSFDEVPVGWLLANADGENPRPVSEDDHRRGSTAVPR